MGLHHAAQVQKRVRPAAPLSPAPAKGIPVQLPRCWKAPYGPVGAVEIPGTVVGFTQDDSRLPPQPNNQDVISDGSTGICGHSTVWHHDVGVWDASNASLEMDRSAMVGAWMQVGRVTPTIWANFTSVDGDAAVSDGNVHVFGSGGSAMLRVGVQLDVFDAGQPLGSPPWSTAQITTELDTSNLDSRQERDLAAGTKVQVSGSPSLHLSQGEWILVMAVVFARHVVSLNGTSLVVSTDTTWQVNSICAWL